MPPAEVPVNNLEIFKLMEERRLESQKNYELLHERISNMKDEINTNIHKKTRKKRETNTSRRTRKKR